MSKDIMCEHCGNEFPEHQLRKRGDIGETLFFCPRCAGLYDDWLEGGGEH